MLAYFTDDELQLLIDIATANDEGTFKREMISTEQWAALNKRYDTALKEEAEEGLRIMGRLRARRAQGMTVTPIMAKRTSARLPTDTLVLRKVVVGRPDR